MARFHNGLLYRFIPGTVCTPADLTREPVWRGVARRLAEWHATLPVVFTDEPVMERDNELSLSVTGLKPCPSPEAINAITPGKGHPNIWTVMQKWIFALPDGTDAEKTRNAVLQKELSRMVKELGNEPGLGQDGVCGLPNPPAFPLLFFASRALSLSSRLKLSTARLRPLRSLKRQRHHPPPSL